MRIALIGYGKMGKEIEAAAIANGHEVVVKIDSSNPEAISSLNLTMADVAIEFSTPSAVVSNIKKCFDVSMPVVVGTTGWYKHLPEIKQLCEQKKQSLLYASNFSIGVNIVFELNRVLAQIMNLQPSYDVSIEEIHHTQKKDAPSGTALTLAKDIIDKIDRKTNWIESDQDGNSKEFHQQDDLLIHSKRSGEVVGTHVVRYDSVVDKIELRHEAKNRAGFVQGALVAAEWIIGKTGCFTMQDLLQLEQRK